LLFASRVAGQRIKEEMVGISVREVEQIVQAPCQCIKRLITESLTIVG
jgi:hypothetical protein